ncbi:MAG: alcohol dehydrogenase catalytic domain-containing protein [Dehalococcoidales bacterium]|nr:alcohol dehydrogenase catalytic domain-containing protein [Dehalococcoidales bacterium]
MMKAAVFYGAKDFRIEDIEKPEKIEPTDVLLKVKACGICGSDLHSYKQGIFSRPGFVMGHELAGEVVKVGSKVKDIKLGDRLVPMGSLVKRLSEGCGECFWCKRGYSQWCPTLAHKPCGKCDYCKSGKFWMCPEMQRFLDLGYSRNGGYAEYLLVIDAIVDKTVYKIPDSVSWEEASFLEPLSGATKWVSLANPKPYETAVVIGLGTIGLLVMQVLKQYVSKVIVAEVSEKRLKLAKELGADVAINVTKEDALKKVMELTGIGKSGSGKGGGCADIVMECSGVAVALQQAIEMTRTGGRIVLVGLYEHDIPIDVNHIIHKQLSLISSFRTGPEGPVAEIKKSMQMIADGRVKVKPLISHTLPLANIMDAFEIQTKPDQSIKVIVKP